MLDQKALCAKLLINSNGLPQWVALLRCLAIVLMALGVRQTRGQSKPQAPMLTTVSVVMLSDLHFDPFHDPAKVPLLARTPISHWRSILAMPDAPDQTSRFASLQETCKAKEDMDASYPLLRSSLEAARAQSAATAGFITLSGDLLVHDLDCRYRVAMKAPVSAADDPFLSAAFAEKTTAFVIEQVEAAFPTIPVYVALGNNDSRCNHNRLDVHDEFLKASALTIVAGLRGANEAEITLAQRTFESAGYYAVTMPAPMLNTRLIVLNDTYMMPAFTNCEGMDDRRGEQEQLAWLRKELDSAQTKQQRVWLLGHLPPSINADSSLSGHGSFCAANRTVRFQDTEALADEISAHADTITLGIFGHTHMDDLHLIAAKGHAVPIKVVASVSPVDGNLPSFTLGSVDPASATLTDYAVFEASNKTGVGTTWSREYEFNAAYHQQGFTAASLSDLISRLRMDKAGTGTDSRAYQTHFLKGSKGKKLSSSWPGYVCSLDSFTDESFNACVCDHP